MEKFSTLCFRLFSLFGLPMLISAQLSASTYSWTGTTDHDWFVSTNWSPNGVPGSGDNVTIAVGSFCAINSDVTIAQLTINSGATLNGSANLTVTGDLNFLSGSLSNTGNININGNFYWSGGVLGSAGAADMNVSGFTSISSNSYSMLLQRAINMNGGGSFSGTISLGFCTPNAVLRIPASTTFTANINTVDIDFYNQCGGNGSIDVLGTFIKTGSKTLTCWVDHNNTGTTLIQSGKFILQGAGAINGQITCSANTILEMRGSATQTSGTIDCQNGQFIVSAGGSTISSASNIFGPAIFSAGTLTLNSPSTTFSSLTFNGGGTLNGSTNLTVTGDLNMNNYGLLNNTGTITVNGNFSWSGGFLGTQNPNGNGDMSVAGTTTINSNSQQLMLTRALIMNGGGSFAGTVSLGFCSTNGVLRIPASKTFTANINTVDIDFYNQCSGSGSIDVLGTFIKTGSKTLTCWVDLNNTGTTLIQSGKFILQGSGAINGQITCSANTILEMRGSATQTSGTIDCQNGQFIVSAGGSTISSASNIFGPAIFSAGTLTINSPSTTFSSLTFNGGGTLNGSTNLTVTGDLNMNNYGLLNNTGTITVNGNFSWSGGFLGTQNPNGNGDMTVAGTTTINSNSQQLMLTRALIMNGGGSFAGTVSLGFCSSNAILRIPASKTFTANINTVDIDFYNQCSGNGSVEVLGTFIKTGSKTLTCWADCNNTGTTLIQGGKFTLQGSGAINGQITCSANTILEMRGFVTQTSGTINCQNAQFIVSAGGSTISSASNIFGPAIFSAGTLTDNAPATTFSSLTFNGGGTLNGSPNLTIIGDLNINTYGLLTNTGTVTVGGNFNWSGGAVGTQSGSGSGDMTVAGPTTIQCNYGNPALVRKLIMNGGGTFGGSFSLAFCGAGAVLQIPAATTFTVNNNTADLDFYNQCGGSGTLDIQGTFVKTGSNILRNQINYANTGTLNIQSGTFIQLSTINNLGIVKGFGTLQTNNFTNSGTVAPGASPGILTFANPSYNNTGGTLEIELAGTGGPGASNGHDQLVSTGSLTLGGTLKILLLNGYVPAPGTQFAIASAGSAPTGSFSTVSVPPVISCYSLFNSGNQLIFRVDAVFSVSVSENSGTMPNDGNICLGDPATITASSGVGSNTTYHWNTGATTPAITVMPAAAGTYNYTCTVTYNGSCAGTVSQAIQVNALPAGAISISENSGTPNDGTICDGSSATLTASGGSSYLWDTGATTASISVSPITNHTYQVTIANVGGCPTTASQLITVIPNVPVSVTISANPGTSICAGTLVTFTATPVNGGPNPTYQWYLNGNAVSGATNPTYSSAALANNDVVTVVLNSSITCTTGNPATSPGLTMSVTPVPNPAVSISASPGVNICAPANITFTATPTAGGSNPTYQWLKNGNPISGATASTYTAVNPLNGDVFTVQMTSNATCAPVGPVTSNALTVQWTNPVCDISGLNALCAGVTSTYTTNCGTGTYAWSITNNNTGAGITSGANSGSVTLMAGSTAGSFTLQATFIDPSGCSPLPHALIKTITVNPLPTPAITVSENSGIAPNDGIICDGASATLTATGGGTYEWSPGGLQTASITVSPSPANTYPYSVAVTNAFQCTATATQNITVNPIPPCSIGGSNFACALTTDNVYSAPEGTGYTYQWSIAGAGVITSSTTGSYVTVTANSGAPYNFTLTVVVTANGCSQSCSKVVIVSAAPNVVITESDYSGLFVNDGLICPGASATLDAGNWPQYLWSNGSTDPAISVSPSGNPAVYTVTVTSSNACSNTASATLTILTPPSAAYTPTGGGSYCNPAGVIVGLSGSEPSVDYSLNNSFIGYAGVTVSGTGNALSFGSQNLTGDYSVTATSNVTGCITEISGTATVSPQMALTTTVSPATLACNEQTTVTISANCQSTDMIDLHFWVNFDLNKFELVANSASGQTLDPTGFIFTYHPFAMEVEWSGANPAGLNQGDPIVSFSLRALTSGGSSDVEATGIFPGDDYIVQTNGGFYTLTSTGPASVSFHSIPVSINTDNGEHLVCGGVNYATHFNAITPAGSDVCSYDWSFTGNPISYHYGDTPGDCGGPDNYNGVYAKWINNTNAAQTQTVSLTVNFDNGCSSTAIFNVTVFPVLTPMISVSETSGLAANDGIICAGATATLSASSGNGDGNYTYTWSTGETTQSINVSPTANETYSVTILDAPNFCGEYAVQAINVTPLPIGANYQTAVCSGATTSINLQSQITNGLSGVSFSWSAADNPQVTGETTATSAAGVIADLLVNNSTVNQTVVYTVTPASTDNCAGPSFTINVTVYPKPHAVCPGPITITTSSDGTGDCAAAYMLTHPGTNTTCAATMDISFANGNPAPASIPSGGTVTPGGSNTYTFSKGVTQVTYTATDADNNQGQCTFSITVNDDEPPVAVCKNITVNLDGNGQASITPAQIENGSHDNCGATTLVSVSPNSFTCANIGSNTVTLTVKDGVNMTATCTATVTVADNQPPTIACPDNATINTTSTTCEGPFSWTIPVASDNCSTTLSASSVPVVAITNNGPTASGTFPKGVTSVTYTATDPGGNMTNCVFTVTVNDATPPAISNCPANITVNTALNQCANVANWTAPTASDNCPGVSLTSNYTSGATFNLGSTPVTYTATDAASLTSKCTFTVTVVDHQNPSITCPNSQNVTLDANCGMLIPNLTAGTTSSDNCGSVTLTQAPAAGSVVPAGNNQITMVIVTSNDSHGNTNSCMVSLIGKDLTPPAFTCPTPINVNLSGTCQLVVPNVTTGIAGSGNCSGPITYTQTPAVGTVLASGHNQTHNISITATDGAGNASNCTMTVTGKDVTAPTFTCPAGQTLNLGPSCEITVPNFIATLSGTDNCGTVNFSQNPAAGSLVSTTPSQQVPITVTADDTHGNLSSCTVFIVGLDITPPTFTCPPSQNVNLNANCQVPVPNLIAGMTGLDNCSSDVSFTQSPVQGALINSGNNQTVTVTVTATDNSGNHTNCQVVLTGKDVTAPVITCPASVTVSSNTSGCRAIVSNINAVSSDNCSETTLSYTLSNATTGAGNGQASGQTLNTGSTTVTYKVTDGAGLTKTCVFTVYVNPCLQISGRITWENDNSGVKTATVVLSGSASDSKTTDASGNYTLFPNNTGNFTITPSKNINPLNGVTAADATRIQQHVAGNPLPGPYKLIAADVSHDNAITTFDATIIIQALNNNPVYLAYFNTAWRFIPKSYTFPNPNSPWGYPQVINLTNITTSVTGQDFTAVKIGDVNGSANPQTSPGIPLVWTVQDVQLNSGEDLDVIFHAAHCLDVAAFQCALHFDPQILEMQQVQIDPTSLKLEAQDFGLYDIDNGEIRMAWAAAHGVNLQPGTNVFHLKFKVLQGGHLLSEVLSLDEAALPALSFNTALQLAPTQLVYQPLQTLGVQELSGITGPKLFQNRPNPFNTTTVISFTLPQACEARIRILDATGRLIIERSKSWDEGYHEETFDLQNQVETGLLYYEIMTPYGSAGRVMLRIE